MLVSEYKVREIRNREMPAFEFEQLRHMAYNGDYHSVYSLISKIPETERAKISDKYILFETITGSINRLNEFKHKHEDFRISTERMFILEILDQFINTCKQNSNFPRHLFHEV